MIDYETETAVAEAVELTIDEYDPEVDYDDIPPGGTVVGDRQDARRFAVCLLGHLERRGYRVVRA